MKMAENNDQETSGATAAVMRIRTVKPQQEPPERPSVLNPNAAPVLVKLAPPFSVRACQFLWVVSFVLAGLAIIYFFVVREDQLPLIVETIRDVNSERTTETYQRAADIIYWSAFASMIGLLLIQITLLVSFTNRKPGVRWWQFITLLGQALLFGLGRELIAAGDHGEHLRQLLAGQLVAVTLALLVSNLRGAVAWSVRRHDVRKGLGWSGGADA